MMGSRISQGIDLVRDTQNCSARLRAQKHQPRQAIRNGKTRRRHPGGHAARAHGPQRSHNGTSAGLGGYLLRTGYGKARRDHPALVMIEMLPLSAPSLWSTETFIPRFADRSSSSARVSASLARCCLATLRAPPFLGTGPLCGLATNFSVSRTERSPEITFLRQGHRIFSGDQGTCMTGRKLSLGDKILNDFR